MFILQLNLCLCCSFVDLIRTFKEMLMNFPVDVDEILTISISCADA